MGAFLDSTIVVPCMLLNGGTFRRSPRFSWALPRSRPWALELSRRRRIRTTSPSACLRAPPTSTARLRVPLRASRRSRADLSQRSNPRPRLRSLRVLSCSRISRSGSATRTRFFATRSSTSTRARTILIGAIPTSPPRRRGRRAPHLRCARVISTTGCSSRLPLPRRSPSLHRAMRAAPCCSPTSRRR